MKVRRRSHPMAACIQPPPRVRPCKQRKRAPAQPLTYAAWIEPRFEFDPEYEEQLLNNYEPDPDADEHVARRKEDAYYEDLYGRSRYDYDDYYDDYSDDDSWRYEDSVPMDDPRYPLPADEASWLRVYGVQSWEEME